MNADSDNRQTRAGAAIQPERPVEQYDAISATIHSLHPSPLQGLSTTLFRSCNLAEMGPAETCMLPSSEYDEEKAMR